MEFSNPPPDYDAAASLTNHDLVKEVERLKQKMSTDPDFKRKIKDAFIAQTGSNDYAKKVRDDIDKFTQSLAYINDTFNNVGIKFQQIDQQKLDGPDGKVWKFEDEWNSLRDRWKTLLRQSQEAALKTISRADELDLFCKGILKIDSAGDQRFKDTLTELEGFIKKPDQDGRIYDPKEINKQARTHSKTYGQLKYDLTVFKAKFNHFAEFVGVGIGLEAAVLHGNMAEIEAAIFVDGHLVLELGVALALTEFTTLAGGAIALAIGPLSIGGVALIVIEALSTVGEASAFALFMYKLINKEKKRDNLKNEVKDKEKSLKPLESVKYILENREQDTGFAISQLDLIRNTWLIISNEANLIYSGLQKVVDAATLNKFKEQIENVLKAYSTLSATLSKITNIAF